MEKKNVLFVCTGNSVRSQMAEAFLKEHGGDKFNAFSAGVTPAGVNRIAKEVMYEEGISMEGQRSKHLQSMADKEFDYVIPLCEVAVLSIPKFPGEHKQLTWYMDDPIRVIGDDDRKLFAFRFTRDLIKRRVLKFIEMYG